MKIDLTEIVYAGSLEPLRIYQSDMYAEKQHDKENTAPYLKKNTKTHENDNDTSDDDKLDIKNDDELEFMTMYYTRMLPAIIAATKTG